jgi:hypothetical protein
MMMELLTQDKVDAAADQEQRMMVLTALLRYQELIAARRCGGSRVGKAPNKDRHRLAGALLLDSTTL